MDNMIYISHCFAACLGIGKCKRCLSCRSVITTKFVRISVLFILIFQGTQVPEVISTGFQPGSEATAPSVVLDLQIALDDSALPVFGEFAVTCKINNKTVSTADADQYLLLYDIPKLESVTPEYASVAELSEVSLVFNTLRCFNKNVFTAHIWGKMQFLHYFY